MRPGSSKPTPANQDFLAGVIEGFYGPPWSQAERFELFDLMDRWGLNTYVYAPKDDLKHRALWREAYSTVESETLGEMIRACGERRIRFIYALAPGLDIRYSREVELTHLRARFEQMLGLGCQDFALLFDDIPDRLDPADSKRFGSFASAQCHVANTLFQWTRDRQAKERFLFCPTPYCGRMAGRKFGGEDYLPTLGRELRPEIDVFWTGPEIISREIPVAHMQDMQRILRRKPVIWDNLHANDYDGRRFYCGPYAGRPPELRREVKGLLVNPNNEFPLNYVPLRTLAEFVKFPDTGNWNARQVYLDAMREWLPHFATVGQPVALDDLILFGDCFYLPYEEGSEAETLFQSIRGLIAAPPGERGVSGSCPSAAVRLQAFCARMTELRQRSLFNALSRRVWDLREELALLHQWFQASTSPSQGIKSCTSDFHLPGTYRGGMVSRLQSLLVQERDGTFVPATTTARL